MPTKLDVVEFSISSTHDGELLTGTFACVRRPTPRQLMLADRLRREQLGEFAQHADESSQELARMLGWLAVSVTKSPTWWKESNSGLDLELSKIGVVKEIFEQVMEIQNGASKETLTKADEDKKVLEKKVRGSVSNQEAEADEE